MGSMSSPGFSDGDSDSAEALQPLSDRVVETLIANHAEFKKFLARRLPDETLAEDLLQNCMAKAVERRSDPKAEASVVAWFYAIIKNALIDYYRAHATESDKNAAYLKELTAQGADRVSSADEVGAAVCACMKRLLPTLKPSYAEVIQRIDLGEESPDQVARDLGVTPGNLAVRLYRARLALRASLVRSCGTCTEHGCLDCDCG
jgi:RNA polymerase sigma factor (sigma-70 family)